MTEFNIKLAGVPIAVKALFPETKDFCKSYLTEESAAFSVALMPSDISEERIRNERQMALEGLSQTDFTDEYIETLALYRKITAELLSYGVLLFHGAVIACEGKAYIFTAKSGTGKTTHCNLWLKHIPDCHILNGDKPLIKFADGNVYACGTPWRGKEELGTNEILPLGGISVLERSKDNHIKKITFSEAFPLLLTQSHRPEKNDALPKVIKLLKNLEKVNLYRLGCNMDPDAATVAYNGMVMNYGNNDI